jgi:KDO2-lipid IV(A) lauroyltransferase
MIQYFLYKFGLFILHAVPRTWAYAFAAFVARLHCHTSASDRLAVIHNLRQITGRNGDLAAETERVFVNFGRYLVDFFLMYKTVDAAFVREQVTVVGREHLEAAQAKGRGCVIVTAHVGNWEMGAAVIDKLGYPVTAIALPHKNPKVNVLFNRQRESHGVTVVPANVAVRRCIQALRKGKCVAVLGDRDFGSFGEPMDFLGRKTQIPKGAAFFACRTGAAVIVTFLTPDANGRYTMSFSEPIYPSEGFSEDDVMALMRRYVPLIERKIKADPTQWLMFREYGLEFENMYPHPRA